MPTRRSAAGPHRHDRGRRRRSVGDGYRSRSGHAARRSQRAGLTIDQIDLIELNEAFAAQALACMKELELDPAKVNVYGGAIALGHALGSSGSRMLTTLVHALHRRNARYGLATMCIGVGQGIAMIVERT